MNERELLCIGCSKFAKNEKGVDDAEHHSQSLCYPINASMQTQMNTLSISLQIK